MSDQGKADAVVPGAEMTSMEVAGELTPTLAAVYANYVGLVRTPHDLTLDFFAVEPGGPAVVESRHVARVILPVTILKGLHDALGEHIAGYQNDHGWELPNLRARPPQQGGE